MKFSNQKRLSRGMRKHLRKILRGLPKGERLRIRQEYLNKLENKKTS